jgi:hypothetical protein
MENVSSDIKDADVYIHDDGVLSNDWKHHIKSLVCHILHHLCKNSFTINPLKCTWAIKEADWLGYWLTP